LDTIGRAEEIPTTASSALVGALEDSASVDEVIEDILSEQSSEDIEDFEFEDDDDDDRSSKPSHVCFAKSTMKKGHIEVMKKLEHSDVDLIRFGGEDTTPLLEKNEVVAF
jgi:hypothetical protein